MLLLITTELLFKIIFLFLVWRVNWANISTSSAGNTFFFIYNILSIALRNAAYRTFWFTCAAVDAVVINEICHFNNTLS